MLLGDEVGLRADGSEHSASGSGGTGRAGGDAGGGRVLESAGPSILPAMHEPQERATARAVAVRGGLPLPHLPRTRSALRRRADARARLRRRRRSCSSRSAAGVVAADGPDRAHRPRPQPVRAAARSSSSTSSSSLYRLVAIVDAYRVAEFLNATMPRGDGRLGPAAARPEPALGRRACSRSSSS